MRGRIKATLYFVDMRRLFLIISSALLTLGAFTASAADDQQKSAPKNNFKLYGFIRNYMIYDSRESVSGTGDLFYYLPKDRKMKDGIDINDQPSFRSLALTSRLGVDVAGYYVGNVHFGAKIEGDFYSGITKSSSSSATEYFPSNTNISGTAQARLRQAYATATWKGTDDVKWNSIAVKVGQAWHPMAGDHPHIFSLEAGAPFGPFSRTPQMLMDVTYDRMILSAGAIWQMQYQSSGPIGASAMYMKYGMVPELYAAVAYKKDAFLVRASADLVSIKPRVLGKNSEGKTVRVSDRKTSMLYCLYTQYTEGKFAVKAKTTFGESGEHMNLMSGYAKISENSDGSWDYASLRSSSSWLSMSYGKKWQAVLFLGYIKNLGLAEGVEKGYVANSDVYFCGNGFSNINQMYRINPQVIYNVGKLNVGLEYQITSVQYGEYDKVDGVDRLDAHALATNGLHWITNNRVNMMIKYNF